MAGGMLKCPVCKKPYTANQGYICKECKARICQFCAPKHMWKCPVCKSPFGKLERVR